MTPTGRDQVLGRVREALKQRAKLEHPGRLTVDRSQPPVDSFRDRFTQNGGEVAGPEADPREWLVRLLSGLSSEQGSTTSTIAPGAHVPASWIQGLPVAGPEVASVGVSMAWGAAGDSGSVLLESTGGRRVQLLPPVHVVFVPESRVRPTLGEALEAAHPALPATLGVHSGPSKSADIGSTLVKGVHGPGRIIAVLVPAPS
ncbi:MAG: LutC/YkgG family protein [Longimicrobiales bacterium]